MADGWHVVSQQQRDAFGAGGQLETVVTVTFQTDHGIRGSVNVPLTQFNAETVKRIVDERVAHIDAVQQL